MLSATELRTGMQQFSGTEAYHQWSFLFRNTVLTDGAHWLAENAGACWLMDAIASYQPALLKKKQTYQFWSLKVSDKTARLTCENGDGRELLHQDIEYTDFPLDEVKLYCMAGECGGRPVMVILLPSEY